MRAAHNIFLFDCGWRKLACTMGPNFHQSFHTKQRTLYRMNLFYNITTTPPFREPRTLTPPPLRLARTASTYASASLRDPRQFLTPHLLPSRSYVPFPGAWRTRGTAACRSVPSRINQDIAPRPSSCRPRGRGYRPGVRSHQPTHTLPPSADSWKLQGCHGVGQAWSCCCRVAPRRCVRGEDAWFKCVCFHWSQTYVPCG